MKLFGKNKTAGTRRDLKKAMAFFKHAQTVSEARNYDYAVDLYLRGLWHDPANMVRHEALYDVALRRKVAGGKPASLKERLTPALGGPIEKMLHAEKLWSKDPLNLVRMLDVMERAVKADEAEDELNLGEVAFWVGSKILEGKQSTAKPSIAMLVKLRDLFADVGRFEEAVEACQLAYDFAEGEQRDNLGEDLKDFQAELAMQAGYGVGDADGDEEPDEGEAFRKNVKDIDKQKELEAGDSAIRSEDQLDRDIAALREKVKENADDRGAFEKLIAALRQRGTTESDNEAIEMLLGRYKEDENYRWKIQADDVRMRQLARQVAKIKKDLQAGEATEDQKQGYVNLRKQQIATELEIYQERVENYPTDSNFRFEYGKRLFEAKQFDEAIEQFQETKSDPRLRAPSQQYLGQCYNAMKLFDEAIDTLRAGVENHQSTDDRTALQLRFLLMQSLARKAREENHLESAQDAVKLASHILQNDIKFNNIRDHMTDLRALVEELKNKQG